MECLLGQEGEMSGLFGSCSCGSCCVFLCVGFRCKGRWGWF